MFDLSAFGLSNEVQAAILQGSLLASALLPFAQKVVNKTKNTTDNKIVDVVGRVLSLLPRFRLGK